jgi:rSAM/selenodomain-associated transferase 1
MMFVKMPERGAVKSRLALSVGKDTALNLYKCFVSDIIGTLTEGEYPLAIFFHPPGSRQKLVQWLGDEHTLFPQAGDDLGERMKNAFKTVFSRGFRSALLIGSDSPDLPKQIIDEALISLKDHDVVLGPSYDGGYYLIGFKADAFLPQVFDGIVWSTPEVFKETLDVQKKTNPRFHILPKWRDIDTLDDLKALYLKNRDTAFAESETIKYMEQQAWAL